MTFFKKFKTEKPETTDGIKYYSPYTDIYEINGDLKLFFDIPGSVKDKINLKVEKDVLYLEADTSIPEYKDSKIVYREYIPGRFSRSFTLPDYIDSDKIEANYTNGVLELTLPKLEQLKPKEVSIHIN